MRSKSPIAARFAGAIDHVRQQNKAAPIPKFTEAHGAMEKERDDFRLPDLAFITSPI